MDNLLALVLSENEKSVFLNIERNRQFSLFYKIWTSKEAIVKACGKGLTIPLRELEVISNQTQSIGLTFKDKVFYERDWYLSYINISQDYQATLAYSEPYKKIVTYKYLLY